MLGVLCRICAAIVLLVAFLTYPEFAGAQIAPTNSATVSGSVSDSNGKPVVGARVSLTGPKHATTQTDARGLFAFIGVPFGQYQLSAAAAGLGTATRSISVQGDTNVGIAYESTSMKGLKTIASVSANANAQFNVTPASITQVNPIANAFEGKTSWRTILEQIPGVAQAGLANGQGFYSSVPDGPLEPVQLSINGALPYETAILLDDMPLISGSLTTALDGAPAGQGTDLGLYPLNGFGTADVVRGPGAAAPSIVDSIGGSFVLHAPGAVNQNHYELSLSTDPYGGIVANAMAAMRWKKLSAVITYGVNDSPGPTNAATVPFITSQQPLTVDGKAFQCSLGCPYTMPLDAPGYSSTSPAFYGYELGLFVCCYQTSTAWSQYSGSVALNYALSPSINMSIFYAGQTSRQAQPAQESLSNFLAPAGYSGSLPPGFQLFSGSGDNLSSFPVQQSSSLLEEKVAVSLGRGFLKLAALQNRAFSTESYSGPTSLNLHLFGSGCIASAVSSPGCPAGYAATVFNGGTSDVTYSPSIYQEGLFSNNRDLLFEYTTPMGENLHTGVSFVKSYYTTPIAYTFGGPGYSIGASTASGNSQTTDEFRFFVGGTPSAKTSLDLSMYVANVDYHVPDPNAPYGPSVTVVPSGVDCVYGQPSTYVDERYAYAAPRLGFVWRPSAPVAIRASAGGGFAEAPLSDLSGLGFGNANGAPSCFGISCSVTLTNIHLRPETSFGFDLGTDIRLPHTTVFSFDVYRTKLYGQLYNSTSTTGSCPTCGGLPLYVTQYGNLSESQYEGVLIDLRHDVPHGVYWAFSGGLTRGYVMNVPAGFYNTATCTKCINLTVVPGVNFNGTFTQVSVPYSQALSTFGYRWSANKYVDLVGTYYGNNNTYFRPAFAELDGHFSYPLSRNSSLLVTLRNITGIYDGSTQIFAPTNFIGVPTMSGLPVPEYGEEYGPRTIILTTRMAL